MFNIYAYDAYDAYFLECAGSLKSPLITLGRELKSIAQEMGILVL